MFFVTKHNLGWSRTEDESLFVRGNSAYCHFMLLIYVDEDS